MDQVAMKLMPFVIGSGTEWSLCGRLPMKASRAAQIAVLATPESMDMIKSSS